MPPSHTLDRPTRRRIAAWVRYKMKELEWTQSQVCERTGVNRGTLSRLLHDGAIGLDVFAKLSRGLPVNPNDLLNKWPPGYRPEQDSQN